ncbi:MAG: CPBP family intramembrane metalloprotease [Leptospiraceae bacterium]|nr:CPBP family intramembrane metalloprotease [Leptospiraceae bacterium]MDW7976025.1 CPBP family intramembrane glutamic endopeptidase [Leptospiraceae bacterium]
MKIFYKFFIVIYLSLSFSLDSQSPIRYAIYGIIPGLGQALLGNYLDAAIQFTLFGGFLYGAREMAKRKDYVVDSYIDFDLKEAIYSDYYRRYILPNIYPPTNPRIAILRKNLQLLKDGKWFEINPLIEYGNYERKTYASTGSELLFQSAQHVWFYSIYSSYRDAGGIGSYHKENYLDLVVAPFQWRYLNNFYFWIPIGVLGSIIAYNTTNPPKNPTYTLLYPGMKKNGYMNFYSTVLSFNAAVSEEAFFRGFLNHYIIQETNFEVGLVSSSLIFGLAHYYNGIGNVFVATIMGVYLGYLHYKNNWDFRQSIAIHFWWNMLILLNQIRYMKEDRNVLREERDVYFMPVYYQVKF